MPPAGKVFESLVGPGGVVTGPGAATVLIEGKPASIIGDTVSAHGEPPHSKPFIITGSSTVRIESRNATVVGISQATCGHKVSTGATSVIIGR